MSRTWEPHLDYSGEPMRPGQFRDPPESWAMSEVWTGRPAHAGTPLTLMRWRLYGLLYPSFECELCVGQAQEYAHCCYCAWNGAVAPGRGAGPIREWLRSVAWRWFRIEGASYQEDLGG